MLFVGGSFSKHLPNNLGQTLHSATFSLDLCVHLEKIISHGGEFTGGQKIELVGTGRLHYVLDVFVMQTQMVETKKTYILPKKNMPFG